MSEGAGRPSARGGRPGTPSARRGHPGTPSAGQRRSGTPSILLTGVGKRYDIVSCFAKLTKTIAVDPSPLAPARHAATLSAFPPRIDDPNYVPYLAALCEEHDVGAVLPLTDLDIEVLSKAREDGLLPSLTPSSEVARATYDKYAAHELLTRLGLPSPPTALPRDAARDAGTALPRDAATTLKGDSLGDPLEGLRYPVMVKPRQGSGARSIHLASTKQEAEFFVRYVKEPTMVQWAMGGEEFSIDCLGDLEGRCLNAIPRTMIESRGGESIKGEVIADEELVDLGRRVVEALKVRGPVTVQVFRDPEIGVAITDVNTRFGGAFPAPVYAALPGRTYPELIVKLAAGESVEPHVGEFRSGMTFTRYYWQLELDSDGRPTGREIVEGGPPAPSRGV